MTKRRVKLSEEQFKGLVEVNMDDLIGTGGIDKPIYGTSSLEEQPGGTGGTPPVRYRIDAGGCLKCTGSFNPANCPYVDSDCTSTSNSSQETWTCKKGKCTKVIGKGGIGEFSSQQECEDSYCEERARPTGDNRSERYDEGADLEGPSKYGYGNDAPFKDSPNFNVGESLTKRIQGMLSEVEEDYDDWDQEQLDECCLHEPDFITDGCCANGGNPDGKTMGGNHGRDNHMWDGKSQMTTGDEREGEGTSLRYRGSRLNEQDNPCDGRGLNPTQMEDCLSHCCATTNNNSCCDDIANVGSSMSDDGKAVKDIHGALKRTSLLKKKGELRDRQVQAKSRSNSTQPVNGHIPRPTHSNQNVVEEVEQLDEMLEWGCCCKWINWAQYSEPECESWGCRCDRGGPTVGKISGEPIPDHSEEVMKDGNIVVIWPRRRGFVPEDRDGDTNMIKRKDRKGMGENSHHLVHRTHEGRTKLNEEMTCEQKYTACIQMGGVYGPNADACQATWEACVGISGDMIQPGDGPGETPTKNPGNGYKPNKIKRRSIRENRRNIDRFLNK